MTNKPSRLSTLALALAAVLAGAECSAVSLNASGLGQALIYPYYTVRTAPGGNAFNTYLSVVNSTSDAKAVRVRLREGHLGRPVLDFNLYLAPNDVWTAAVVPTSDGARLLTADTSCTDPAFATGSGPASLSLHSNGYTGSNADGFGDTLDRTREGYVEMIEMATLTGASAAAVTHTSTGFPGNCAAIRAISAPSVAPPTGGLTGTLTLINVNSGQDFGLDATALGDLATRPHFRAPGDPGADFNSDAIDPVSVVVDSGHVYRSVWSRPVDAVSAVLMRIAWFGEYVLDSPTGSLTDMVLTLPTRHHYVSATAALPPFRAPAPRRTNCRTTSQDPGELILLFYFNRESAGSVVAGSDFLGPPQTQMCAAASVASARNGAAQIPPDTTRSAVLGSTTLGLGFGGSIPLAPGPFQNGWIGMSPNSSPAFPLMSSLTASTRIDIATGQVTAGAHTFMGLPLLGFSVRTFANGTLACGAGSCQGNYGSAFALKYIRSLAPP